MIELRGSVHTPLDLSEPATRPVPVLVRNFDAMRENADQPVPWETLEHILPLFPDVQTLQGYFEEARSAWEYVYDEEKVRHSLATAHEDDSQKYLKTVRRFGLIFKASYKFFHEDHYAPDSLQNFVATLGEHNDRFNDDLRGDFAAKLLTSGICDALRREQFAYRPPTMESFRAYLSTTLADIHTYIDSSDLAIHDFHVLRKKIRLVMNMLQIPASHMLDQPPHHLFLVFYNLSKKMGDTHDNVVQETLHHRKSYKATVLPVPEEIKKNIERGEQYLIQSLCLR